MTPLPDDFALTTDRLRLRMPQEADIPHVFDATRTSGFNDGMFWDPPHTADELHEPLRRAQLKWKTGAWYQFTIEVHGEFAGRIALRPTDDTDVLDVGYWTHPRLQGQGIMTEALRIVVALGFERMDAIEIVARYAVWNGASRRVLEAVGFRTVEICPGGFVKGDQVWDEAHARLDRSEWKGITSAP